MNSLLTDQKVHDWVCLRSPLPVCIFGGYLSTVFGYNYLGLGLITPIRDKWIDYDHELVFTAALIFFPASIIVAGYCCLFSIFTKRAWPLPTIHHWEDHFMT